MSERDSKGRFLKGCKGGPGNPKVKRQAELQAAVREAVTAEELQQVLRSLRDAALDESNSVSDRVQCARVLLERTCGKPSDAVQTVEMDVGDRAPETLEEMIAWCGKVFHAGMSGQIDLAAMNHVHKLVDLQAISWLDDLSRKVDALEAGQQHGRRVGA